jgi:hypothetical protein
VNIKMTILLNKENDENFESATFIYAKIKTKWHAQKMCINNFYARKFDIKCHQGGDLN